MCHCVILAFECFVEFDVAKSVLKKLLQIKYPAVRIQLQSCVFMPKIDFGKLVQPEFFAL